MTYPVRHGDHFVLWSSVCDAPATCTLTREELIELTVERAAEQARADIERRLALEAERPLRTLAECVTLNRAGKDETWLSAEQLSDLCDRRREDIEYEIQGIPQRDVCCMCGEPIAAGEAAPPSDTRYPDDDRMHARCKVSR